MANNLRNLNLAIKCYDFDPEVDPILENTLLKNVKDDYDEVIKAFKFLYKFYDLKLEYRKVPRAALHVATEKLGNIKEGSAFYVFRKDDTFYVSPTYEIRLTETSITTIKQLSIKLRTYTEYEIGAYENYDFSKGTKIMVAHPERDFDLQGKLKYGEVYTVQSNGNTCLTPTNVDIQLYKSAFIPVMPNFTYKTKPVIQAKAKPKPKPKPKPETKPEAKIIRSPEVTNTVIEELSHDESVETKSSKTETKKLFPNNTLKIKL